MEEYSQNTEIVRLILKKTEESISEEEDLRLKNWLNEREENKSLYLKIRDSSNYKKWEKAYSEIDIAAGWDNFSKKKIRQRRERIKIQILKYAAIILFPLAIGICLFPIHKQINNKQGIVQLSSIKPGTAKAILILNNGKSVLLDEKANLQIQEKDGTSIQKYLGSLHYSKANTGNTSKAEYNIIAIPRGGEFRLTLSDGTHIYLNSLSKLKYPTHFSGNNRTVELSGEAYFDVIHNPQKPFIVKTGERYVKVLGTSFNVNADEPSGVIATTLVKGKVMINGINRQKTFILAPNDQAVYSSHNDKITIKKVDVSLFTAWKDGKFIFRDLRLEDIMNTLTKWYSANVFYKDNKARNMRFSGSLNRYGDIYQFLDIIKSTNNVEIKTELNSIVFSSKK